MFLPVIINMISLDLLMLISYNNIGVVFPCSNLLCPIEANQRPLMIFKLRVIAKTEP